ncbi:MAG: glycosyltransferase family 9 protein, partial [Terriglobales bacterium]
MSARSSFLIVKLAAAGDVLLTTALAHALRQARPEATIGWVTTSYAAPLLENNPDLDEVLALPAQNAWAWIGALRNWRRRHRETTLLLAHRSRRLYVSARLWHRGPVIAWGRGAAFGLESSRLLRQQGLLEAAGIHAAGGQLCPQLCLSASEGARGEALWASAGKRPRWVIAAGGASNPWSAMPNRVWPRERFLELALRAHAAGVALRWIGSAGDRERTEWICARLPEGARTDLAGKLPLRHSAGVIAGAHLVIGNDSLALVMAHALARPAMGLYGPTRAALIHAPGQPCLQGIAGCGPCYDPRHGRRGQAYRCPRARCMEQI